MVLSSSSILIIGAGIFGLSAALELRLRGWHVTVIAPGAIPFELAASTDVSKIVRADYGADELYTAMGEAAIAAWRTWNERWPAPLYHEDGFLLLSTGPMAPGGFEYESYALLRRRGHPVERLAAIDRSLRLTAWARDRYPDGYLNHRAGWVESGAVVSRLAADVRAAGVRTIEHTAVPGLVAEADRIVGVRTSGGDTVRADAILVAAGAWTPGLLPHLQTVMWTTGQPVIHFDAGDDRRWRAPDFPVWAADISHTGWYGFPALPGGALKIGHHGSGHRADPDAPRRPPAGHEARVRRFLRESLPSLAGAPVREMRVCLYCDTFDGDFWIDHDPERPGLIVAAGDSGHGFKFAPVLGPLIADVVERRPNPWASRFQWRARVDGRKEAARAEA